MATREIVVTCEIPEVYQLALETRPDGTIEKAQIRGGYTARGMGRLVSERYRDPSQAIFIVERLCGICSHSHTLAFCQAVEAAMGIQAPARAAAIRTVVAELERLQSHTLNLHEVASRVGARRAAEHSWTARNIVTELLVAATGNRVHYGMNCVGGVTRDVSAAGAATLRRSLRQLDGAVQALLEIFEQDVRPGLDGLGIWTSEAAQGAGTGPNGRASGVSNDMRRVAPYAAYGALEVPPVRETAGDAWSRTRVRLRELRASVSMVDEQLGALPGGPLRMEDFPVLGSAGTGISAVEAPRGANEHEVELTRSGEIAALRISVPTPRSIPGLEEALVGAPREKSQTIVASFDLCMSCADGTL